MTHQYEILPKGKQNHLYRLEEDGTAVRLAYADDKASLFRLMRMKALFEEVPIPLEEMHAAADRSLTAHRSNKPSWGPSGSGGGMEVWQISEAQTRGLKQVREKAKDGLHKSVLDHRTVDVLLRHSLVRKSRSCTAYLVLTDVGNELLGRIER